MKRALITGISGFVGSHLAELLLDKNFEVHGIVRWRSKTENIDDFKEKLILHDGDMTDLSSLIKILKQVKPNLIFHLAAQSFVLSSWKSPSQTLHTNVIGTSNLLEAIISLKDDSFDPIVQFAGSSEEYGLVLPNEVPIKETNPLRPLSPYGVSKVATDMLAHQHLRSYGIRTIVTRSFNSTGPRRGEVFVCSTFAKQIAEIEKGKKEPVISHGNLDAKRDFTDVRDIARAYLLAVEKCKPGEVYNICSGKAHSMKEILSMLLSLADTSVELKEDPERMRPSDVSILHGDYSKFKKATGWQPTIEIKKTLEDLLNYWRERV
jgi:GDP-4-dehydro-6-deoxy-D-mannose reductase